MTDECEACLHEERRWEVIVSLQERAEKVLPHTDEERTWQDYEIIASGDFGYTPCMIFAAFVIVQTIALEELNEDPHNECVCMNEVSE